MKARNPSTGNFEKLYVKALDSMPVGIILEFPTIDSTKLPNGYMFCDGSALSRVEYADLFAIIGTSFGAGDGSTTFNLPTKEGLVSVGIKSSDTDFDTIGETGGSKHLQQHKHTITKEEGLFWSPSSGGTWGLNSGSGVSRSNIETDYTGTGNSGNLQPYTVTNYIIKATQTRPLTATVVNEYNNNQINAYSTNYINNINKYSTSETFTGKYWVNGKPIYRKVFSFTLGSTVPADYVVANMPSNYEQVTLLYAIANMSGGNKVPIPISWNNAYDCGIMIQSNRICIRPTWDAFVNATGYVILEYTKTS